MAELRAFRNKKQAGTHVPACVEQKTLNAANRLCELPTNERETRERRAEQHNGHATVRNTSRCGVLECKRCTTYSKTQLPIAQGSITHRIAKGTGTTHDERALRRVPRLHFRRYVKAISITISCFDYPHGLAGW